MAVTRLKRRVLKKKKDMTWRKNVYKHLTSKPVLKKNMDTQVEKEAA